MKPRALFIGDSLIEFFDWRVPFPEVEVTNAGKAGETAQELLQRLTVNALQKDYGLVVVMIGANNFVMEDYGLTPVYDRIMAVCRAKFPAAVLVACGLPPFPLPWLSSDAVTRMNVSLRTVAESHHATFLDLAASFDERTAGEPNRCFLEDGVHLNDLGYAIWSETLGDIIEHSSDRS